MDSHFDFLFKDKNIDVTVDDKGVAWFQGPQIASILGYSQPKHMYRMLSPMESEVRNVDLRSANGVVQSRSITMINEYGLYQLITLSRRSEAVEFKNWLFFTVLPSIRRYGAYIDPQTRQALDADPNLVHDLNQRITTLEDRNIRLATQNRQLKEQNALLIFSNNVNQNRMVYTINERDFYHDRALFYQHLLGEIDDYCLGDAETLKRVVQTTLDRANNMEPLERDDDKQQMYHLVNKQ